MDPRSLDHYDINWTLVDTLSNVIATNKNSRSFDTNYHELAEGEYMLMAELTLSFMPDYLESPTTTFNLYKPPHDGICSISEDLILIGSTVSLSCKNW